MPNHNIQQPQQFTFATAQNNTEYQIEVKPVETATEYSVANILLESYKVGDSLEVTAPLKG